MKYRITEHIVAGGSVRYTAERRGWFLWWAVENKVLPPHERPRVVHVHYATFEDATEAIKRDAKKAKEPRKSKVVWRGEVE